MQNFLDYKPAHYVSGKSDKYVAYSVINPKTGKLSVKKIKLNYIKSAKDRKVYAKNLIMKINKELANGLNPYLANNCKFLIKKLSDAVKDFLLKKRRELELKTICAATFDDYKTQLQTFQNFLISDYFVHEISESMIINFLDVLFIEKKLTAYTRNHYLQTIKTFLNFCKSKNYVQTNNADFIKNEKNGQKKRESIPAETLTKIFDYLNESGQKYYLFACWLLYSCFVRPSEICGLKISNINFANQTIFIPAAISKNKKNQVVTIPHNVANYIIDLKIWEFPQNFYIIGKGLKPSETKISAKILRNFWNKLRDKLNFSKSYQFYSLKDSGITRMINLLDIRQVRDQARHSNISITDVYTDRSKEKGNERIKKLDFNL